MENREFVLKLGFTSPPMQAIAYLPVISSIIISDLEMETKTLEQVKELLCSRVDTACVSFVNNAQEVKRKIMNGEKITPDWKPPIDDD